MNGNRVGDADIAILIGRGVRATGVRHSIRISAHRRSPPERSIEADAESRDQVAAAVAAADAGREEVEAMEGALAESVRRARAERDALRRMPG